MLFPAGERLRSVVTCNSVLLFGCLRNNDDGSGADDPPVHDGSFGISPTPRRRPHSSEHCDEYRVLLLLRCASFFVPAASTTTSRRARAYSLDEEVPAVRRDEEEEQRQEEKY